MTVPPPPRGRKRRLIRSEDVPDDLLLMIRAMPADRSAGLDEIVDQAILSAGAYVIERANERRELLFGVSVFAHREGQDVSDVLYRFPTAPMFVEVAVGVIRGCGFEVFPTGSDPDHFDVQLVSRVTDGEMPPTEDDVRATADLLLDAAGPMQPNPSYAVGAPVRLEEE